MKAITLALPLAGLLALSLSACAPDTSAAYQNCVEYLSTPLDPDTLSVTDYAKAVMIVNAECTKEAKAAPAKFNNTWGDLSKLAPYPG